MNWKDKLEQLGDMTLSNADSKVARRLWNGLNVGSSFNMMALADLELKLYERMYNNELDVPRLYRIIRDVCKYESSDKGVYPGFPWDKPQRVQTNSFDEVREYIPENVELDGALWPWLISAKNNIVSYAVVPKSYRGLFAVLNAPFSVIECTERMDLIVQDPDKFVAQFVDRAKLERILDD